MAHYRTINVKAADKAAFINYCETIDSTEIEGFTFLLQNNKQKAEPKIEIKEVEKPLSANEFKVKISQEDLSDNIQSALKKTDNLMILRKHSISDFRQLAEKVMQDKNAINEAFTFFLTQLK